MRSPYSRTFPTGDAPLRLSSVRGVFAALVVGTTATLLPAAPAAAAALPACPLIFGHGGYPSGANGSDTWNRDQVRQPNHPTGIQQQKNWGAAGVEADLQLTRDGTKAVMWHNDSTWGLTGVKKPVNQIWWAAGDDKLQGRRINRGVYVGETVYTFREWLSAMRSRNMIALVEIKPAAKQSLFNGDAAIKSRAWSEILGPIKENYGAQEIMVYSHDSAIWAELQSRVNAQGLSNVLRNRPVWTDSVEWEEPPPAWTGNTAKWQSVLDQGPKRVATTFTDAYHKWLKGKCA
ncbi:glycerophosphodiester phosphodiesterase family protein [Streptosporangium sandarakinum]|uniref:glycerophosphodiester phosphodiesterase family protein n=1 Tax=Streptosporangium sandarakinum TaxID=1260955 RepID=UPI0037232CCC